LGGPHSRSGRCGEEKKSLPQLGIEEGKQLETGYMRFIQLGWGFSVRDGNK